ncbi:MAG: DUF952 domain-containing protein [Anaerolineae bacterium]|nr:DUF952 domain-containing protein [Anaerolineae bacterium]
MDRLMHICPREDWEAAQAQGAYRAASLESEGFIHCSRPEQVEGTANRFYSGEEGLVLLHIDPELLGAEIRWEAADGQVFPHIYGPLELGAVVEVQIFNPDETGKFSYIVE